MKNIEVCLSPELLPFYEVNDKIVVVIDIFRATSCIVTAFANGIESIIPVAEVADCKVLQSEGYLAAAERDGDQVEGFDFGNSPLAYLDADIKGKTLAMTTSNGTQAIDMAKRMGAREIIIGAFLNKTSIIKYLLKKRQDTLLLCAGWKGRVNLEDSIFAGNILDELINDFKFNNDACGLARSAYHLGKNNPTRFLTDSSHFQRLKSKGRMEDIDFCLTIDKYDLIPVLSGDKLVLK